MIFYLVVLASVFFISWLGRVSPNIYVRKAALVVAAGILVLVSGVRDVGVGTDSAAYVQYFYNSNTWREAFSNPEFGYYVLNWFARSLSDSYVSLFILVACVFVSAYLLTIAWAIRNYEIGIYLFVALGIYAFSFNGVRQALAMAICFYALRFLIERKLLRYASVVLLAATFHNTALIALPLFWIAPAKTRVINLIVLVVGAIGFALSLEVFVGIAAELLDDRYAMYGQRGDGGGHLFVAFLFAQGVVFWWLRGVGENGDGMYTRLLNVYLVGLVPAFVSLVTSVDPSGLLRLHFYFSHVAVLLWPILIARAPLGRARSIVFYVFILLTLIFYVQVTRSIGEVVPYRMNPEVFQK